MEKPKHKEFSRFDGHVSVLPVMKVPKIDRRKKDTSKLNSFKHLSKANRDNETGHLHAHFKPLPVIRAFSRRFRVESI